VSTTTQAEIPVQGTVGLAQAIALYTAAVLGTGVLVLPALAAATAGPASILAVIAMIVLSIPLAGTFAALASRFPDPGGVATYVRRALGPLAARMAGYWFFFGVSMGTPVVAVIASSYIVSIFGGSTLAIVVVAALILVPPLLLNIFGLRVTGTAQLVLTGLLVAIVVFVIALAFPAAEPRNFDPFLPHGWLGVGAAVSLFVWAFSGWEAVTHIAGEFRNPRRTIPIATAVAIVVVGMSYLALQVVTVAVLGDSTSDSTVPLLDLVRVTAPGVGPAVVAAISAVVALGVLNTYIGAFAKLGAALGRDRDLPRWLAAGAESGGVPRRALAVVALLAVSYLGALVANGLDLAPFILIQTSCMVAVYALGAVAAVRLLARFSAGWWLAVSSVVLVAGLLILAGPNLLAPAVLAACALIVAVVRSRLDLRSRPRHDEY
jgi:amino acid efflux transporter